MSDKPNRFHVGRRSVFAQRHPHLAIALQKSDRVIDVVEEGIDVAIRLGRLRDSSLRAAKRTSLNSMSSRRQAAVGRASARRRRR
ncbi:LysR substrate-binding domain-containing protein [Noviherbaspirillum humi]|uniref:LysR substrate-binding domain-containing protein n=1 Tax=Noviherbaspirillum humi TaxID=1688639 RepID=UPI000B7989DB|nr:LysR substrate-binding domain-containing protein [Noviherbaspirillum humi]